MKEKKIFKICPECKASVRDINYDYHMAKVHRVGSLDKIPKPGSDKKEKLVKKHHKAQKILKKEGRFSFTPKFLKEALQDILRYADEKKLTPKQTNDLLREFSRMSSKDVQTLYVLEGLRTTVIMEYALLRKDLGLMEIEVNDESETIKINTNRRDDDAVLNAYMTESKFIDIVRRLSLDKQEEAKLPKKEEINSKPISEVAHKFKAKRKRFLKNILESSNKGIFTIKNGKVFVDTRYDEFREWFDEFHRRYANAFKLADLVVEKDYNIIMDGVKDINKITERVGKEIDEIVMKNIKKLKSHPLKAAPLEINDWVLLAQESESVAKTGRLLEGI